MAPDKLIVCTDGTVIPEELLQSLTAMGVTIIDVERAMGSTTETLDINNIGTSTTFEDLQKAMEEVQEEEDREFIEQDKFYRRVALFLYNVQSIKVIRQYYTYKLRRVGKHKSNIGARNFKKV